MTHASRDLPRQPTRTAQAAGWARRLCDAYPAGGTVSTAAGDTACPRCGAVVAPGVVLRSDDPDCGRLDRFAAYHCPDCHAAWSMRLTQPGAT